MARLGVLALLLLLSAAAVSAKATATVDDGEGPAVPGMTYAEANEVLELGDDDFARIVGPTSFRYLKPGSDATEAPESDVIPAVWFVMFYAPWCGHCQKTKPVFLNASLNVDLASQQAPENVDRVAKKRSMHRLGARMALVDATKHKILADTFHINSFPTFYYFVHGIGYKYDGGYEESDFIFLSRYLYLGSSLRFVNIPASPKALLESFMTKPIRVPVVLHVAAAAGKKGVIPTHSLIAPPAPEEDEETGKWKGSIEDRSGRVIDSIVFSSISTGRTNFFVWSFPLPLPESSYTGLSVAQRTELKNIETALQEASRGPNGEAIAVITDRREDHGAEPYKGAWDLGVDPFSVSYMGGGRKRVPVAVPAPTAESGAEEANTTEPAVELVQVWNRPMYSADVNAADLQQRFLSSKCPTQAAGWVMERSHFPVEMVSVSNFRSLAKGRLMAMAIAGGIPRRDADDRSTQQARAFKTMQKVLQMRKGVDSPFRLTVVDLNLFSVPVTEWLGYTAEPDRTVTFSRPLFIVFDMEKEQIWSNQSALQPYLDLLWGGGPQDAVVKLSEDEEVAYQKALVAAIDEQLTLIQSGMMPSLPTSVLGRIAQWIPGANLLKQQFNWDDTMVTIVVGSGLFLILVLALALRPQNDVRNEEALTEQERAWLAARKQQAAAAKKAKAAAALAQKADAAAAPAGADEGHEKRE